MVLEAHRVTILPEVTKFLTSVYGIYSRYAIPKHIFPVTRPNPDLLLSYLDYLAMGVCLGKL
jgi:hypothetical protein